MCAAVPLLVPAPQRPPDFSLIVHRGLSEREPENSMAALDAARRAGAPAVEFDVRLTADERFVVMHDHTLDRTTDCHGQVHRTDSSTVRGCHLDNGEPVMLGADYLREVDRLRMNAFLEIKADPLDRWTPEVLERLRSQLAELKLVGRTSVFSFEPDVLCRLERAHPEVNTVWISRTWPGYRRAQSIADGVALYPGRLNRRRVRTLQQMGLHVYGRNTNGTRDWHRYRRLEVDGVLVDDAEGYVRWR